MILYLKINKKRVENGFPIIKNQNIIIKVEMKANCSMIRILFNL